MVGLAALDWGVMAAYGAVVIAIGVRANLKQKDAEDYFLGGRRMPWWVIGISLVATSFSSVSLIAGTGFGFREGKGLRWLQLQIGDLVGLVVVCLLFLPYFSGLRLTTAYEYLEERFGVVARCVASALFIGQTVLRAAILVLAPALALSAMLGWRVEVAIVVTAAAAIVYSAFGGLAAVVWTDLIQMSIVVFGVLYCLFVVAGDVPGGMGAILDYARRTDRLEVVTVAPDRGSLFNVLGLALPYAVLTCSLYGTGQQAVQRFLACRDLRSARLAALTGWGVGSLALGLTLFLGVCLAAWVALAPGAAALAGDQALPGFIEARLPAGLQGLLLAAIFAASMSSLDSAIHSTATATIVDFLRRFSARPPEPRHELLVARATTVAFGVLATGFALLAEGGDSLLETLVTWLGYFAGPLLGLFLLGMATRRATEPGALLGVGVSFAAIVTLVLAGTGADGMLWGFHPLWLAPVSCASTLLLGWVASRPDPAPEAGPAPEIP